MYVRPVKGIYILLLCTLPCQTSKHLYATNHKVDVNIYLLLGI